MFKFGFNLDLEEEDDDACPSSPSHQQPSLPLLADLEISPRHKGEESPIPTLPFTEHSLSSLLSHLPKNISHSPLSLPDGLAPLARRDLFDARFQRLSAAAHKDDEEGADGEGDVAEGEGEGEETWGPETDLVKGVYEGGLKTWECAGDLAAVLERDVCGGEESWKAIEGKNVMEVGCGTAVPTCHLLRNLLSKPHSTPSSSSPSPPRTTFHLLDYNTLVLELVTLPNLLLAARPFLHLAPPPPASTSVSAPPPNDTTTNPCSAPKSPSKDEIDDASSDSEDEDEDDSDPMSFSLSPSTTLRAFQALLSSRNIHLRFFSGGWDSFPSSSSSPASPSAAPSSSTSSLPPMDLILTSETIYQSTSLRPLINLLRTASHSHEHKEKTVTYVAAKILYFGLEGGGVPAFERAVEEGDGNGWVEEVYRTKGGVGRWVGKVGWGEK